ncbi:hypothetical protein KKJ17_18985 [Xenorhabdus bovienii]|uniref:Uncharacterized protein n=1 Tax=Xenorhabdus bovienii TaxID=40576 RepID=A0AAJ1JBE7_XENBV|nr:hypothetical protein [Xenorhabdus bovienii]MDE1480291.1 hypothetical protein [Xenorhabdus bovienii]MDE1488673.1 hypothetical protein [Xenorhabdus bovienii]MDE1496354.1 hypothetical protein [Xenorhabdus bovienii]MDE9430140.1 hypothetical protein [Xenorhabdus bovienii]MDE9442752.1 hypothetical protein [Xenorhabdus bovienii]
MKNLILFAMIFIPSIALSSTSTKDALDYCATSQSWAAQKVIYAIAEKNKQLDKIRATSSLIERTKLVKGKKPVIFEEWGQLYTQTIEISIPYIDNQKKPVILIASSIISAEECSLTEPAYFDITPGSY